MHTTPESLSGEGMWDQFDVNGYQSNNYPAGEVQPEDQLLAEGVVAALASYLDRGLLETGMFMTGGDVGTCAVPRLPAMVAPFMNRHIGTYSWGDIGRPQIAESRKTREELSRGELGRWQADQDHLTSLDARWKDAFQIAGKLVMVGERDFRVPQDIGRWRYGVVTSGHCIESATNDIAVWEKGVRQLLSALVPGGLFVMSWTTKSTGYKAGVNFPAVPITEDDVRRVTDDELIERAFVKVDVIGEGTRDPTDPHYYEGFGAVVGIRAPDPIYNLCY